MPQAVSYPRPGRTRLLSLRPDGAQANGIAFPGESGFSSEWPTLTPDGRYVAFHSVADNLVPGDTNQRADVFLRDNLTGEVELISEPTAPGGQIHDSWAPRLTPDARFVAIETWASLVPEDEGWADVYVIDRHADTVEWISPSFDGSVQQESSFGPSISDDGRYVAFSSDANNIVPGDINPGPDVFVRDRLTGATEIVSVSSEGVQASAFAGYPSISSDGRYVAFNSRAPNLVVGDTNNTYDDFVHDRQTGETILVSVSSDGAQGNGGSFGPYLSADGKFVAFSSEATNLVPQDSNGTSLDVFVHEIETGKTGRVSVATDGTGANGYTALTAFSRNGRYVMFWSDATNLVPDDANDERDVFLHDIVTGSTELVSTATGPEGGDDMSWGISSVTPDGRYAAFMSEATNLVHGDANEMQDIFVRDRGPALGVSELEIERQGDTLEVSGVATFSGRSVAGATDGVDPDVATAGGDLVGAQLIEHPEAAQLLVSWELSSLQAIAPPCTPQFGCPPSFAGSPTTVYGLAFTVGSTSYELRGQRVAADTAGRLFGTEFVLYECEDACTPVPDSGISGSIGTTGPEVRALLPLDAIGAELGDEIATVRAFTTLGSASEDLEELDAVDIGAVSLLAPSLEIGLVSDGAEAPVGSLTPAVLIDGRWSVTIDVTGLAGAHRLVAHTCLGESCEQETRLVAI